VGSIAARDRARALFEVVTGACNGSRQQRWYSRYGDELQNGLGCPYGLCLDRDTNTFTQNPGIVAGMGLQRDLSADLVLVHAELIGFSDAEMPVS
jgi:hypothetical protein